MSLQDAVAELARNVASELERFAERIDALELVTVGPQALSEEPEDPTARPLGSRQAQVVALPGLATEEGMKTAAVADDIGYEVPNTYTTLQALARQGVVEQVPNKQPQHWRLTSKYRPSGSAKPYLDVAELVRPGEWCTYGDISIVVRGDTMGARAVGRAAATLPQFPSPHRVLREGGVIPEGWRDDEGRGPEECRRRLEEEEGVSFAEDGAASPEHRVAWDELQRRMIAAGT